MRQSPLLLLFLGLSAGVHADSISDENTRLKQQISALQSRVDTLEHACPAAATGSGVVVQPGVAPAATAVSAPATAPPAAPAPVAVASPGSVTAAENLDGTPQSSVPDKAKAPPKPYASAGCDRGFFSGPSAGRWQKVSNWDPVKKGLTPAEVETAIGVEHYDVDLGNGRTQWQYGRCASSYDGAVEFLEGRVISVVAPDR